MALTSFMDRFTRDPARSEIYGGELIASLLEIPIDLTTGVVGGKIIKFLLGLLLTWYGGKQGGSLTRKGREAYELASHFLLRILDPKPEDIIRAREELEQLKRSIGLGSAGDVISVLFRDPREIKLAFELPIGKPKTTQPKTPTTPATPTTTRRFAYPVLLDEKVRGEI